MFDIPFTNSAGMLHSIYDITTVTQVSDGSF
jgi:hypothetical protein